MLCRHSCFVCAMRWPSTDCSRSGTCLSHQFDFISPHQRFTLLQPTDAGEPDDVLVMAVSHRLQLARALRAAEVPAPTAVTFAATARSGCRQLLLRNQAVGAELVLLPIPEADPAEAGERVTPVLAPPMGFDSGCIVNGACVKRAICADGTADDAEFIALLHDCQLLTKQVVLLRSASIPGKNVDATSLLTRTDRGQRVDVWVLEPFEAALSPRTVLMLRLAWQLRNELGQPSRALHFGVLTCAVPGGEVRVLHVAAEPDTALAHVRRLSAHAGTPMPRILAVAVDVGGAAWPSGAAWDAEQVVDAARAYRDVGGARVVVLGMPPVPGPAARPIARHNYLAQLRDMTAGLPLTLMVAPDCL